MKGDIIIVEPHHRNAAKHIIDAILPDVQNKTSRYIITVAGESGSGKSETAKALEEKLMEYNIKSIILGQDDYFVYPPKTNHNKRVEDSQWLGPIEVKIDLLNKHLYNAIEGQNAIEKPLVDYAADTIGQEALKLDGIDVLIAEGTYTSLCKPVDTKVFIARNRLDTLEHRKKRNRGNEVNDNFVETILETEHKIIMGHKHIADFIITKDYNVKTHFDFFSTPKVLHKRMKF